jgi:hypothetical protein
MEKPQRIGTTSKISKDWKFEAAEFPKTGSAEQGQF